MIYGNIMRQSIINRPNISSPYEILEISANYQFDFASIVSEAAEIDIVNESVSGVTIITLLIKLLKKFGVVIAGVVAAFVAFIAKKNGEINSQKKSNGGSNNGKRYKIEGKYREIERAIAEKDIRSLREAIGTLVYLDRNFSSGEFDEAIKYVESKGIKLKDDKLIGDPTISSQKDSFTGDDLASAVFELKENFCDERIKDVKTVAKWLHAHPEKEDEDSSKKAKEPEKPKEKKEEPEKPKKPSNTTKSVDKETDKEEKSTISIEYKDWQDLLKDGVSIDKSVIAKFRDIIQLYTEYAEKFNDKLDKLSKEDIMNMDHSNTDVELKAFTDPFEKKFDDKFKELKKGSCKIISGGKDNYFGKRMESFVAPADERFGILVTDVCKTIKEYRGTVKTKQFTTTHATWATDFDEEFESVDKLVKEYTGILQRTNKEIQSEIKVMVSKLEVLNKHVQSNSNKFRDIGTPKDQDDYDNSDQKHYPASKMYGNVRPAKAASIRITALISTPGVRLQELLSGIGKIMNCSVTEVSYCASQLVAEKARVLKHFNGTKSQAKK